MKKTKSKKGKKKQMTKKLAIIQKQYTNNDRHTEKTTTNNIKNKNRNTISSGMNLLPRMKPLTLILQSMSLHTPHLFSVSFYRSYIAFYKLSYSYHFG